MFLKGNIKTELFHRSFFFLFAFIEKEQFLEFLSLFIHEIRILSVYTWWGQLTRCFRHGGDQCKTTYCSGLMNQWESKTAHLRFGK
jgi:hypothetical protein